VYQVRPAEVARAIDVLRGGPLSAAAFAAKMWPDRHRSPGRQSQAGHALLRRLGELSLVERVGDYWMIRRFGAVSADHSALGNAVGLQDGLPVHRQDGPPDGESDQQRLERLVRMADVPVDTVTHDAALGDVAILRGTLAFYLDDCIVEACALVVLRGQQMNVYPPRPEDELLVALTPVEAARALHVRWRQSGRPPGLPNPEAWLHGDDGVIAYGWRPTGIDPDVWDCEIVEPLHVRVHRQRVAAGLA
jgi:hypothetical protein